MSEASAALKLPASYLSDLHSKHILWPLILTCYENWTSLSLLALIGGKKSTWNSLVMLQSIELFNCHSA